MQDAVSLKARRFRLRFIFLGIILAAIAAGAGAGLYFWLLGGDGESIRVVTAVQIPYPDGWSEQPLTEADRSAGLLLSLERERPEASFLARTVIARLAADFDIDQLAGDTEAALSAEIDNFDLLSKAVTSVGPFDAVQISYRQKDDTSLEHQVLMTIIPTPNQTFYLTFRAQKRDFTRIHIEGEQMTEAFADQVGATLP